jgi:hypothetical protein
LKALKVIELVDFTILFEEEILMYRKGMVFLVGFEALVVRTLF